MRAVDIPEISRLSIPERILLLEELWDSIAARDSDVPRTQGHQVELDRRLRQHTKSPGDLLSLEELQERIEKRK